MSHEWFGAMEPVSSYESACPVSFGPMCLCIMRPSLFIQNSFIWQVFTEHRLVTLSDVFFLSVKRGWSSAVFPTTYGTFVEMKIKQVPLCAKEFFSKVPLSSEKRKPYARAQGLMREWIGGFSPCLHVGASLRWSLTKPLGFVQLSVIWTKSE